MKKNKLEEIEDLMKKIGTTPLTTDIKTLTEVLDGFGVDRIIIERYSIDTSLMKRTEGKMTLKLVWDEK